MGKVSQRETPADLPPEKRPGTCYTGGYVGSTAGLEGYGLYYCHRNFFLSKAVNF